MAVRRLTPGEIAALSLLHRERDRARLAHEEADERLRTVIGGMIAPGARVDWPNRIVTLPCTEEEVQAQANGLAAALSAHDGAEGDEDADTNAAVT